MKQKTRILKIVLELGSRQLELTMDEARELFESLSDIFGQKQVAPVPYPYPIYVERPNRWYWQYPGTTWGSTTIGSTAGTNTQFSMHNNTLTLKALNSTGE